MIHRNIIRCLIAARAFRLYCVTITKHLFVSVVSLGGFMMEASKPRTQRNWSALPSPREFDVTTAVGEGGPPLPTEPMSFANAQQGTPPAHPSNRKFGVGPLPAGSCGPRRRPPARYSKGIWLPAGGVQNTVSRAYGLGKWRAQANTLWLLTLATRSDVAQLTVDASFCDEALWRALPLRGG